ncbi:MAG: hypothetical protein PHY29_02725 [Syntrophales bacterium]|nr:hypothetical protein [Syntrophales bacterium]
MNNRLRPIRSKHTPLKDEAGKLFRCPQCGFIINIDRLTTPERARVKVTDEVVASDLSTMDADDKICTMDTPGMVGNAMKLMQDGNPVDVYYTPRAYQYEAGCPNCGRVNLVR